MAEVINPAIVPKVTLPSGEQVPCVVYVSFILLCRCFVGAWQLLCVT